MRGGPAGHHWGQTPVRIALAAVLAILLSPTAPLAAAPLAATSMAVALPASAASAPSASAPAPNAAISVSAITPAVAVPGTPVTITGTLTARQRPLTAPAVRVVLGRTPIRSRNDVRAWAGDTSSPDGRELAASPSTIALALGASRPFTLTIPAGSLALDRAWGVAPIVLEMTDSDPADHEVLRTFVGWQRNKEYQPLSIAVIAPVTLPPNTALFDADAATRTDAWRAEVGTGSRIDRILSGTDGATVPVTWAVDPAVLGRDQRTAAQISADPVTPVVAPLARRLSEAAPRHRLWALPYADPDLAATVTATPNDPTVASLIQRGAALGSTLGVPVRTGVAWPADGGLQVPREAGLATAYAGGLAAALVSSSALPTATGVTGTGARRSPSGLPLLAWDDELSRLTLGTRTEAETSLTTQEFIAETATLLAESPGIDRTVVVAMPRTIDPDAASLTRLLQTLAATPWLSFVTTDEVIADAATRDPVATVGQGSWTQAGPAQVDATRLGRIAGERRSIETVAALFPNGGDYRTQWNDTLDQLTSTRWRQDPAGLTALTTAVTLAGSKATSGIRVTEQTTNFLADEGILQITVVNDLPVPVEGLRLVLTSTNPRLRIVSQPEPIRIEKQSRATVQVRTRAVAAGLVTVNASLRTSDGTPVGAGATITVRANPPGRAFYVISGLVVALFLVVGLVRSLRRRGSGGAGDIPESTPATTPETDRAGRVATDDTPRSP